MHFAFKCSFNTKQSFIKDFSLVEKGTGGRGTVGGGKDINVCKGWMYRLVYQLKF